MNMKSRNFVNAPLVAASFFVDRLLIIIASQLKYRILLGLCAVVCSNYHLAMGLYVMTIITLILIYVPGLQTTLHFNPLQ
jgi:hypothetical protein